MSSTFDVKSLPLYRQIALFGGGLFFISLFLPWWGISGFGSASGWNGIGSLAGILVILLIAWEALRILGRAAQIQFNHDLVTAGLAGLTAVFGLVQFIRALSNSSSAFGISAGPRFGAFLILVFALVLGYAAFLAFQAGGGQAALKQAGDDTSAPTDSDVPSPAAPEPSAEGPAATRDDESPSGTQPTS